MFYASLLLFSLVLLSLLLCTLLPLFLQSAADALFPEEPGSRDAE
jgi:hypothetical protein